MWPVCTFGPRWYLMSWRRKLRCSRSLKLCFGPKFSCSETQREIICSRDRLSVCQLKQYLQAGREVSRQAGQASNPGLLAALPVRLLPGKGEPGCRPGYLLRAATRQVCEPAQARVAMHCFLLGTAFVQK